MVALARFLARPGVQASEFKVLLAAAGWLGLNADQHWLSVVQSVLVALPAFVFAVSRGLAKTEIRDSRTPQ